ncbi:MAG: ABC transporter permease [Geminicoccaceae bacterium]|nr:ABC transporter permease [Geminicoccaceae bacterium]
MAEAATIGDGRAAGWKKLRRRLAPWAPLLVLLALCIAIALVNGRFVSLRNFARIADAASIPLVLGLGVTFVILMGSIDLSMEGVVAFAAIILCLLVANGANANDFGLLGALAVLVIGAAMGFANGIVHVGLQIPSFMVTLGMWFVGIGIGNAILGGIQVRVNDPLIRALALEQFLGLKFQVWLALGALAVAWVVQEHTRLGRYIFAIGGGEDLARLSGIRTGLVRIATFTMAGVFYALAGIMAAAQQGSAFALIGGGRLFTAITAVVVGGTALWGGQGGVLNTLIGVLIVVVLANGMVLMGVSPYVQQIVQGLLIIAAVALSVDRMRAKLVK